MPTAVNTLSADVSALLHDTGQTAARWSAADIARWFTAGQLAIVRKVPSAFVKTATVDLQVGTQQGLPADAVAFVRVISNMSASGKPMTAPRRVEQATLDTETPGWHAAAPDKVISEYTSSPASPREFWVSPPQPTAAGSARIQYSAVPPDAVVGGDVSLDKTYDNALIFFALYRALSRDSVDGNDERATKAFAAFQDSIA